MFSTRPIATLLVLCAASTSLVVSDWVHWLPYHLRGYDCTGVPDGLQQIGCWGRLECKNGQIFSLKCYPKMVYSRDLNKCVNPGEGGTSCSVSTFCTTKSNRLYGDVDDQCETFFSCWNNEFRGRQYCSSNLRFNDAIQRCDYPSNFKCGP